MEVGSPAQDEPLNLCRYLPIEGEAHKIDTHT
jgi:hypothetical protein